MKVQTKIILLLLVLTAIFIGGLGLLRSRASAKFHRIADERSEERKRSFDAFLGRHGEPLETLAKDYTYWDAMVRAISSNDLPWIAQNIDNDATWQGSDAHAVWIYRPDRSLVYSVNRLDADTDLHEIPLPPAAFDALDHARLMHFFMRVPQGIMEIRAATVHPSTDSWRQTPPQGFLFAGRLWSNEVIQEFARDSDNRIQLLQPKEKTAFSEDDDADNGIVCFNRFLSGWDNKPLARLVVQNDSETIRELNRSSQQLLTLLIGFALALLLLLTVSLTLWVSRPLRLISQTLKTERLDPIEKLRGDGSEFGGLAELIGEFFGQRSSLIAEIVERKSAQEALRLSGEQLRQAQKMEAVGRLAGGVAHDFNNLLTAILGYAELLVARRDLDASSRQNVEMIQKAGRQAAAVTHQLLAFSRKQVLQPRVIDLNVLVCEFERILRRVIGEHIELHTLPEAGCGRVRADPNQIEQVILNLGVNARDAMSRGGQLTIRTGNVRLEEYAARQMAPDMLGGQYVLLEVADTGEGMDDEVKSRIFEPFFTTKGPGKGTGLGLATVYGVVRQSGGTVLVESQPGEGCTFRIYLPMETGEVEEAKPKTVAPVQPPPRHAETILVVEDEEIVRELVCQVLSGQGYEVLCAANGLEAMRMSEAHPGRIALMITDVVMPQMGGLELSRQLLLVRPETKVLYVSGYSEDDMNDQGALSADMEFLEKPFTPQAITRKVRELLTASLSLAGAGRDGA